MPIDYERYPPNWHTEIVPRILARAGHRCEVCGLADGAAVFSLRLGPLGRVWVQSESDATRLERLADGAAKVVRVVLAVTHLDHDEENHAVADERLLAQCQWCHLRYDAPERLRRRYLYQLQLFEEE